MAERVAQPGGHVAEPGQRVVARLIDKTTLRGEVAEVDASGVVLVRDGGAGRYFLPWTSVLFLAELLLDDG